MKLDALTQRQLQKREEILSAAADLFFTEGYGRTSMDQIHARVGGSKRTLYSHFPSKDEVFIALIEMVSDRVLKALEPDFDIRDLRETLTIMGRRYLSVLLSEEGLSLYRNMVAEARHFPDLATAFFDNGPGKASRQLGVLFGELKTEKILIVDRPQAAAEQFLGMVRGDIHMAAVLTDVIPEKTELESMCADAVSIFLRGVKLEITN
ncbi:MAG: TetR/AcrR family transcriptional regulator [Sneathiella sp.]